MNVAKEGDCAIDVADAMERVSCTDPRARYQVLRAVPDASRDAADNRCDDVPGTTVEYRWTLEDPNAVVKGLSDDVQFCLGAAGVDPQTSTDLARVGDCLRENPALGWARVSCSDPSANHRVLHRVDSLVAEEIACQNVPELNAIFSNRVQDNSKRSYVLCIGPR